MGDFIVTCVSARVPESAFLTRGIARKSLTPHGVLFTALTTLLIGAGTTAVADTCTGLLNLALPDTTINAAKPVDAGTFTAPDGTSFPQFPLPRFCRVAATLAPTSDSTIKIEVWLPFSGWRGVYWGTGNGGIGGVFTYGELAWLLSYTNQAIANTDLGTSPAATQGSAVLIGHPERQVDYATRSTHLMTVRAKQIINAFYGEPPSRSYFYGCSTGGGQGVHEALQFPGDYDAITAGAPATNATHLAVARIWDHAAFQMSPVGITAAQLTAITNAILKKCVGKDGGPTSDNFLTDPRACSWDPTALQCGGMPADPAACLTGAQVAAMRKYYQGPINPRTGERIFAGHTLGSERNPGTGNPLTLQTEARPAVAVPRWVFGANWDWRTFDDDHDVDTIDAYTQPVSVPAYGSEMAAQQNANTADLGEFKLHGGKLILWHGFEDQDIPTLDTIAYYERLIASQTPGNGQGKGERKVGLRRTQEFARLFLLPGVGHCFGGAGADNVGSFGWPSVLLDWVEHGILPDRVVASKVVGGVTTLTRPLCPYPALSRYRGVGDPTKAESFDCVDDGEPVDNQPPAPKYLNDRDNYPIVPIDDDPGDDNKR
jgi:feruloyl esterase